MKKLLFIMLISITSIMQAQTNNDNIHEAVMAGDLNKVQAILKTDPTLLETNDKDGNTPLITACLNRQIAVANILIDQGADVNAKGMFQFTPLIWASDVPNQDTDLLQRLINKGAGVNIQGRKGTTPLHRAAFRGGIKVAKLLIDNGAQVNVVGYNGVTPLHRAAQTGDLKVAKLLIDNGADVNIYDKYTGTVEEWDINGTILQVAINLSPNEETAKLIVESGANLNKKDYDGNTELHLAAMKGYADLARILITHGADVNAVNQLNRTPLYYAAKHGYRSVADVLIANGAEKSAIVETNYGKAPQLTQKSKDGEAYIWSLSGNFSYVIKTKENLFVFISDKNRIKESLEAGLANGYLNPTELAGQNITMFISHRDRFQMSGEDVGQIAKLVSGVKVVSSFKPDFSKVKNSDIPAYHFAQPNESFAVDGIKVHTIPALGGGLGYFVEADEVKFFFAGLHITDNVAANVDKYRKEVDYLKPFGPVDVVMLPVVSHSNRVGMDYVHHLYLIDQLSPKTIFLTGANNPAQYTDCAKVLKVRNILILYPEGGGGNGDRFHYLRNKLEK